MFEDALVESSGKLKSKSKYWMMATFALNLALVGLMVLIPLLHPEALPRTVLTAMLIAPPPPPPAAAPPRPQVVKAVKAVAPLNAMTAPIRVPNKVSMDREPPAPLATATIIGLPMNAASGPGGGVFGGTALNITAAVVVKQPEAAKAAGPIHVSSGVAAGAILSKATPAYPAIAKAAHVSGVVVLHAVISKTGAIQSLQVISGPEMLRPSALDAVRQWRYRPYLLNGEPTEVDTSVTVNFSFGG